MERRTAWPADLEVRRSGKRPRIFGRFPYNKLAVMADRGKVRKERILPGAFAFALNDPAREINLLFGHDFDKPLASKRAGSLIFEDTSEALTFTAEIAPELEEVTHIRDAINMLDAGLVTGVSPGFRVPPKDVVPDAETLDPEPGNPSVFIRSLAALVLYELSLVTRPAYQDSAAELRALQTTDTSPRRERIILP